MNLVARKKGTFNRKCGWKIANSGFTFDPSFNIEKDINCDPLFPEINEEIPEAPRLPSKPNILFILADDMGATDTGYLGADISTPNSGFLGRYGPDRQDGQFRICSDDDPKLTINSR